MNAKQGFHWKTIEKKPDNWEKLHQLIKSSYVEINGERDKYWDKKDIVIDILLSLFPDLKDLFTLDNEVLENTPNPSSKKKMKGKKNTAQEIRDKNDKEIIKKDLQNIKFDRSLRPLQLHFSMEISFVIMILIWNYYLQKKQNVDSLVYLDGLISLNRIIDVEYESLQLIKPLYDACIKLKNTANNRLNEDMYSLLFDNPILLVESTADKRKKSIQLYKEQKTVLNKIVSSIILDEPLFMGNQMPTGTGKSFLAVILAQKINKMRRNKTVLFACSNELVNQDIASTSLLGDDIHLWMASLIRDENTEAHILLRPYKRCFPAKWKSVYKDNDENKMGTIYEQWSFYTEKTGKTPDIIVADLEACYELLKNADEIDNPFIAYIDEYISDKNSNHLMAKISHHLPKHTILLSAILPHFESLDPIISRFCEKYECEKEDCLYRVETNNIPITCAVIDQNGRLRMPHHLIDKENDLAQLIEEIRINPRIRRCYTAKHIYYWSKTIEEDLKKAHLDFIEIFPDIGKIRNENIINYTIQILEYLQDHFHLLQKFQEYRPLIMDKPDPNKIFTEQALYFEGKTLFISNNTFKHLENASEELFDSHIKYSTIVDQNIKNEQLKDSKLEKLKKIKIDKKSGQTFSKIEREQKMCEILENSTTASLPHKYVINSKEHFKRFHNDIPFPKNFMSRSANNLSDMYSDAFSDKENLLMSSGVGFYDKTTMTSYQRNLVMNLYRDFIFICSCKDIVFGTNLPELVNVYISKDFAIHQSLGVLYQLMGRVGRIGKSYHANIILDDEESVKKILSLDSNIADDEDVQYLINEFKKYI